MASLKLLLILAAVATSSLLSSVQAFNYTPASLDEARTVSVSRHQPHLAEFSIPADQLADAAFRLRVTSATNSGAQVLVTVQHRESADTWTVSPALAPVARTLCPPQSLMRQQLQTNQTDAGVEPEVVTLTLATQSADPVRVEYSGQLQPRFILRPGNNIDFSVESPTSPRLFALHFKPASSHQLARLAFRAKPSRRCAVVQLHRAVCPVRDTGSSVISSQTLTGSGHLLANSDRASASAMNGSDDDSKWMFLTVRSLPDDSPECGSGALDAASGSVGSHNFSLSVESLSSYSANLPVVAAFCFFVGLLLLAPVSAHICWQQLKKKRRKSYIQDANHELESIDGTDSTSEEAAVEHCRCHPLPEGVPSLKDVGDSEESNDQKIQTRYFVHAAVAAVFFCLPALQLVISSQRLLHESGNQDICYYNFACMLPVTVLGRTIYAFNSVLSNLGYVILGVAFLACVLVHRRSMKQRRVRRQCQWKCGVPHNHGLHLASGLCMSIEGLLSAGYHLCPSSSSFQFDTAFMLVLAALLMLLVLTKRRPQMRPPAHWGYLAIACLLLLNTLGSTRSEPALRAVVFAATGLMLLLAPILGVVRHARQRSCVSFWEVGYGCLWVVEAVGAFASAATIVTDWGRQFSWWSNTSYGMFPLACLLLNTAVYLGFYLVKKLLSLVRSSSCAVHRTGVSAATAISANVFCLAAALIFWTLAMWQFAQAPTDWKLTPALSRAKRNRPCIVLDFFDAHDVWHFSSSLGMFFSFLFLLTLDDDVADVPRDKLEVF